MIPPLRMPERPWPPRAPRPTSRILQDIEAALSVVAERNVERDDQEHFIDLSDTDLRGAYLVGGNLSHVDLRRAHLEDADLRDVVFSGSLAGANLRGANLENADLRDADISEGDLRGSLGDASTKLPAGVPHPASWSSQ
jgi:hypothetical protein